MHTSSLQRRTLLTGLSVITVGLLAANTLVYLVMRTQLLNDLDEVLADRTALVRELAENEPTDELIRSLQRMGMPATLHPPDGEQITTTPAVTRLGARLPPPPDTPPPPVRSATTTLPDGTHAEIHVSSLGTHTALRRLLWLQAASGTATLGLAYLLLTRGIHIALAPLDDVIALARRIAQGQTNDRLRPNRTDTELGRLAHAFDELLDTQQAALNRAHASDQRSRQFLADASPPTPHPHRRSSSHRRSSRPQPHHSPTGPAARHPDPRNQPRRPPRPRPAPHRPPRPSPATPTRRIRPA